VYGTRVRVIVWRACRGHLGGLLGGAALAYLLGPRLVVAREGREVRVSGCRSGSSKSRALCV
jgi:hypothetical protein